MSSLLIRGGRLIDPSRGLDRVSDVLIRDGRIAEIGVTLAEADETLDACGWIVCPGFIDTHVAVRDPGFEEDEVSLDYFPAFAVELDEDIEISPEDRKFSGSLETFRTRNTSGSQRKGSLDNVVGSKSIGGLPTTPVSNNRRLG